MKIITKIIVYNRSWKCFKIHKLECIINKIVFIVYVPTDTTNTSIFLRKIVLNKSIGIK